jgi:WD40 repeat protein
MRKKENVFYEKIENDYILKKIKIEELIRKLNLLLNEFTLKMNIFQRNMQNIFHIINISYYLYFNLMKKEENKNKLMLNDKLLDIKFISQNTIDLNDLSIYFNKKLNSFDSNLSDSKDNIENIESDISKIFNYELIWSESPPKKKFILKEDNSIADSITKIIQIKSDENLIASAQMNGLLNIWDLNKKEVEIHLKGHKSAVWALIENSEGYLISGGSDNVIKIWDIQSRKENSLINIKGHKGTIYSICEFEKDKIISGSDDMCIKIWQFNLNNKKNPYQCFLNLLDPNNSKIKSLIYIPKSNVILTGNEDNFIKIYSLSNKVQYVTNILEGHSCTVWCLIPFYEDTMLASGSSDNSIRIWDLMNWRCLYSLEGHENTISSLVLLRNEFLGSSSWDCTCKIWNLETRSCIYTLKGHKDIVWSFIELKNGQLATCFNDKNIIIWEKN